MQIKDAIREFFYELTIQNYSPKTVRGYRGNIMRFNAFLDKEFQITELEEIMKPHIKKYIYFLQQKGLSETYINGILKNIRSFFRYCANEGYCLNIAEKMGWLKEKKTIIQTFTDLEVKKMLDFYKFDSYIGARNKCIISTLFDTGIRCLELCDLKILDVRESVIFILGKGNKERVVPISPFLKKIMIKYERIRNSYVRDDILHYDNYFLSYRNKPLTDETIGRIVKKAAKNAKVRQEIRCSPHTCRHWFAQAQLKNGLDVYSLSRLMGHETVNITKRYLQGLQDKAIVELGMKTSPLMNLKGGRK